VAVNVFGMLNESSANFRPVLLKDGDTY
jgi:hypothetical protein